MLRMEIKTVKGKGERLLHAMIATFGKSYHALANTIRKTGGRNKIESGGDSNCFLQSH